MPIADEIRLTTFVEYTIPPIVPGVPRRQKLYYDADLKIATVNDALREIGGLDPGTAAYIVCSEDQRSRAEEVAKHFRLPVIMLPPEMLSTTYGWAIVGAKGTIFSSPQ